MERTITLSDFSNFKKDTIGEHIDKIIDISYNGIDIDSAIGSEDNSIPMCWDAAFALETERSNNHLDEELTGNLIISGGVDCSGFGSVDIKLPLSKVADYYSITIDIKIEATEEDIKWLRKVFGEMGIETTLTTVEVK